ncbi:uracil-DNA glycosylase family protein [Mangrovimonas sp. AS39]|uniref:uracil-DNA glycosylase family protein n=1 Tax=Mangrovimonas futianensis TaxID=2895523 RepID=UPI001E5BC4B1|nr:uracil-DNA glycosylase family protein [Mangrovimonas futianensis]MCF1190113.1 uracil-DNA glycosylase family protein [Mangrovimonas futianensis]MCF1194136.1 uracil-DNA glycosylase family protein [Mangrovimonas futianensis]
MKTKFSFLDGNLHEEIIKILTDLLQLNQKELKDIYDEIKSYDKIRSSESSPHWGKPLLPTFLSSKLKNFSDGNGLGIDLPIWFNWDDKPNRLMIIGIDPLRKHNDNRLILGSPFGLATKGGRETQRNKYWNFVEPLLVDNSVYIMDVYKLFVKDSDLKKEIRNQKVFFYEILKRELDVVKPNKIITLGKAAASSINNLFKKTHDLNSSIEVINLPHLSPVVLQGLTVTARMYQSLGQLKGDEEMIMLGKSIENKNESLFD